MIKKKTEKKEGLDEQVNDVASQISKALKLDELSAKIDVLMAEKKKPTKKTMAILGKDLNKGVGNISKEEKIYGFMQAMIRRDKAKIKALTEGGAASGAVLVPNEFRAEIIKEVADQYLMRNLVRVVPMKRRVMDIPKELSTVKVSWIYILKSLSVARLRAKAVNSVKTLTVRLRAIPSRASRMLEGVETRL